MKTKVVNIISGPGSGKSLMNCLIFTELKMMHYKVELVQEKAKELIYQKKFDILNDQFRVSTMQYNMIKSIDGQVEYITADSGIITGVYYNRHYATNTSDKKKTEEMILEKNSEFDNIYIFLERNPEYEFETNGRVHNEVESKVIDIQLKEMLFELHLPFKSFVSDRKNIPAILEYIFSFN